jgi:hypothetical protein
MVMVLLIINQSLCLCSDVWVSFGMRGSSPVPRDWSGDVVMAQVMRNGFCFLGAGWFVLGWNSCVRKF